MFITADMEGVATVAHDEQVDPKGADYPRIRELMTGEVIAAIEGAKEGGASEILVCDAHFNGRNLLVEKFPDDVEVIQGAPYELGMMSGISDDFDACFEIGYHAMRHTRAATIGHTFTFTILELSLNGTVVGEPGLSAAIAGHFRVPLVLVSGDSHAVQEARRLVRNVVGVPTKKGVGLYGTRSLTPTRARELIRKGARKSLTMVSQVKPFIVKKPVLMKVRFERPLMAHYASRMPLVRRADETSVAYRAKDMVDAFHVFEVMTRVADQAKSEGPI